jgi:WD40 repeat protein
MSSDGRWLAAASLDGEVTLWDLSRDELPMVRLTSSAGPATFVRLDRSLRWLAVGHEQGLIELWDLRHARLLVEESDKRPAHTPPKTLQPAADEGNVPIT